jgi:hypothetical protein
MLISQQQQDNRAKNEATSSKTLRSKYVSNRKVLNETLTFGNNRHGSANNAGFGTSVILVPVPKPDLPRQLGAVHVSPQDDRKLNTEKRSDAIRRANNENEAPLCNTANNRGRDALTKIPISIQHLEIETTNSTTNSTKKINVVRPKLNSHKVHNASETSKSSSKCERNKSRRKQDSSAAKRTKNALKCDVTEKPAPKSILKKNNKSQLASAAEPIQLPPRVVFHRDYENDTFSDITASEDPTNTIENCDSIALVPDESSAINSIMPNHTPSPVPTAVSYEENLQCVEYTFLDTKPATKYDSTNTLTILSNEWTTISVNHNELKTSIEASCQASPASSISEEAISNSLDTSHVKNRDSWASPLLPTPPSQIEDEETAPFNWFDSHPTLSVSSSPILILELGNEKKGELQDPSCITSVQETSEICVPEDEQHLSLSGNAPRKSVDDNEPAKETEPLSSLLNPKHANVALKETTKPTISPGVSRFLTEEDFSKLRRLSVSACPSYLSITARSSNYALAQSPVDNSKHRGTKVETQISPPCKWLKKLRIKQALYGDDFTDMSSFDCKESVKVHNLYKPLMRKWMKEHGLKVRKEEGIFEFTRQYKLW